MSSSSEVYFLFLSLCKSINDFHILETPIGYQYKYNIVSIEDKIFTNLENKTHIKLAILTDLEYKGKFFLYYEIPITYLDKIDFSFESVQRDDLLEYECVNIRYFLENCL